MTRVLSNRNASFELKSNVMAFWVQDRNVHFHALSGIFSCYFLPVFIWCVYLDVLVVWNEQTLWSGVCCWGTEKLAAIKQLGDQASWEGKKMKWNKNGGFLSQIIVRELKSQQENIMNSLIIIWGNFRGISENVFSIDPHSGKRWFTNPFIPDAVDSTVQAEPSQQ